MSGDQLRQEFEQSGFVVVGDFLAEDEIAHALADAEAAADALGEDPHRPDRDFWGVHSRRLSGEALDRPGLNAIVRKPELHRIAQRLLCEDCVYDGIGMQVYLPHRGHKQSWHTDTDPDDLPFSCLTMVIYVQDQTPATGMTRLVPGSHRTPIEKRFPDHADLPGQFAAELPAGSLCAFQSTTWHSATENRSDRPRFALVARFCRPEYQRDRVPQYYGRMRHARGARRSGRPMFDHPTDEGSYPWPETYDPAELPFL
ncbi:MAG: hypothetical protein CMJ18_14625 [Phycisphaeraceae bacterium]|nr:hypothetical protein [Phycisphaeraceae bacterium]